MDDVLVRFVLEDLPAADRDAVRARLGRSKDAAGQVTRLQEIVRVLQTDREPLPLPDGLASGALAQVARMIVQYGGTPPPSPDDIPDAAPAAPSRAQAVIANGQSHQPHEAMPEQGYAYEAGNRGGVKPLHLVLAALAGALIAGFGMTAVMKARHESQVAQTKDRFRALYASLSDYAGKNGGKYPQIGVKDEKGVIAAPTAGSFASELNRAGLLTSPEIVSCPLGKDHEEIQLRDAKGLPTGKTVPVGFAYTLGYKGSDGSVVGYTTKTAGEKTPLAANFPDATAAPSPGKVSPFKQGMVVLYGKGNAEYTKSAEIGADHIYKNASGLVGAGTGLEDTCLGRPNDKP